MEHTLKVHIVSDTHFSHTNILSYCPNRNFKTIEAHDEHIIGLWNEKVSNDDLVYHLGDFSFCNPQKSIEIVERLNGRKILIQGNHDHKNLKNADFCSHFEKIDKYLEISTSFQGNKVKILLCHFPFESWEGMNRGTYHLHGHIHSVHGTFKLSHIKRRKDIGVDSREDCGLWELQELLFEVEKEVSSVQTVVPDHHAEI